MGDVPNFQSSLNGNLAALKVELGRGGPGQQYLDRTGRAAQSVFGVVQAACEHGYEVWAHKDSGRILKMNSVGLLRGTRFSYSRAEGYDFSSDHADECERCELAVIERFEVTSR